MALPTLPMLHDLALNDRVRIESFGAWQLYGPDRRSPRYPALFRRGETGLQLLKTDERHGVISILTPCRATGGQMEFVLGDQPPQRICCYACLRRRLEMSAIDDLPPPREWIIYLLLESDCWLNGTSPREVIRDR